MQTEFPITSEMIAYSKNRIQFHIDLVEKYYQILAKQFNLSAKVRNHDWSKVNDPIEKDAYVLVDWLHKDDQKIGDNKIFKRMKQESTRQFISDAIHHHLHTNLHHTEHYQQGNSLQVIGMQPEALAEMVADWVAMSVECSNDPMQWYKNSKGKKFIFSDQEYKTIETMIQFLWQNK